ncbi:MAG: hypothetical protein AB7Q81_15350 [Gammaproteobacteria bacterium]
MSGHGDRDPAVATAAAGGRVQGVVIGAAAFAFFAWWSARDDFLGNLSDGDVYVLVADLFSPWRDTPHALGTTLFADFPFPPLFPALLGLLGGGSAWPAATYLATSALLALMLVVVRAWLAGLLGSATLASAATLLLAALPGTLLLAFNVVSEPLYVAVSIAAVGTFAAARNPRTWLVAAILGGLAVLARSAGIALVAAALVALVRAPGWRVRLGAALALVGPGLAWSAWRASLATRVDYLDSIAAGDAAATAARLAAVIAFNAVHAAGAASELFAANPGPAARAVLVIGAAVAGAVWLARLRQGALDALYFGAYLAMILAWPHPGHMARFLWVLLPIALAYLLLGSAWLARGGDLTRPLQAVTLLALALVATPTTLGMFTEVWQAAGTDAAWVRSPQWHAAGGAAKARAVLRPLGDIVEAMQGIDQHVPPGACVSTIERARVALHGHRRAFELPPSGSSDETLRHALRQCPWVFMIAARQWPDAGYPPMYPYPQIQAELDVVEVKLWDAAAERGTVLTMLARYRGP